MSGAGAFGLARLRQSSPQVAVALHSASIAAGQATPT
jgi:hypothetical protein